MWQANVFTIFPEAFPGNLGVSLIGKALQAEKWRLNVVDLKNFALKHDRVDDMPYGGGEGMVLSPLVFEKAFESLSPAEQNMRRIYLSPRGRQFTQADLDDISRSNGATFLCGRYEGVDQRILEYYSFEEVSVGDFVLMGGEVGAMMLIEGCVRLLDNVVGNHDSIESDSFQQELLEHNQYTRPDVFNGLDIPNVLTSGNHEAVRQFRETQSKTITMNNRPDMWAQYVATELNSLKINRKD